MMTSYVWYCFCAYCTKKYRCLLHFGIIMSHSVCRAQQCWKQDQKYKTKTKTEAGLRPVLSQDRGPRPQDWPVLIVPIHGGIARLS